MASQTSAIAWALSNSQKLRLRIERYRWIENALPGWIDIHCSITVNGVNVQGWGAADTEDLALCKALSEALERIVFLNSSKPTSSGFAAHLCRGLARAGAASELQERDLFLSHFLTSTPFTPLVGDNACWSWWSNMNEWADRFGIEVRFFHLGQRGAVCAIHGLDRNPSFGWVIGTSMKSNIEDSILASFIESGRRATRYLLSEGADLPISLRKFLSLSVYSFSDHGRLALDLNYARRIKSLFPDVGDDRGIESSVSRGEGTKSIHVEDLRWSIHELQGCPFFFAFASSPDVQSMFIGPPKFNCLNLERLRRFTGTQIQACELNPLPHPFD